MGATRAEKDSSEDREKEIKDLKDLVASLGEKLETVVQQVVDGKNNFEKFMEAWQMAQKGAQVPMVAQEEEVEEQRVSELGESMRRTRRGEGNVQFRVEEVDRHFRVDDLGDRRDQYSRADELGNRGIRVEELGEQRAREAEFLGR